MIAFSLPSSRHELWRRTSPASFSFPDDVPSSSLELIEAANGIEGVNILKGREALKKTRDMPARSTRSVDDASLQNDLARFARERARDGVTLIVDEGVRLEQPLRLPLALSSHENTLVKNRIILAPGAEVTIVETLDDPGGEQLLASTEVTIGQDARLTYRRLWNWNRNVFSDIRFSLDRDARLDLVTLNRGTRVTKIEQTVELVGVGSRYEELFVDIGTKKSHLDIAQDIRHCAPQTYARVESRGVVRDRAYSLHHGLIRILREGKGTDSYFRSGHLLLTRRGRADSIPKLEIDTDDVKAGHGHTLSDIDLDALFYLMSRGLPREEAERIYVDGFLAPLYERFPEIPDLVEQDHVA